MIDSAEYRQYENLQQAADLLLGVRFLFGPAAGLKPRIGRGCLCLVACGLALRNLADGAAATKNRQKCQKDQKSEQNQRQSQKKRDALAGLAGVCRAGRYQMMEENVK
jgi:hypothetical protein